MAPHTAAGAPGCALPWLPPGALPWPPEPGPALLPLGTGSGEEARESKKHGAYLIHATWNMGTSVTRQTAVVGPTWPSCSGSAGNVDHKQAAGIADMKQQKASED